MGPKCILSAKIRDNLLTRSLVKAWCKNTTKILRNKLLMQAKWGYSCIDNFVNIKMIWIELMSLFELNRDVPVFNVHVIYDT